MHATRRNLKQTILSLLLSAAVILGGASVSAASGQIPSSQDHWVKQAPGVTEDWHPLIDDLQSQGLLDSPMTRGAFEILIQKSFEGLDAYVIPAGSDENPASVKTLYVTRMEGAFYLHHLLKSEQILNQQLYTDQPDIPAWALESVLGMTQKGIFKGFPDGTFKSRQWLTHAEAICLVAKSQLHWMKAGVTARVPGITAPVTGPQPEPQPEPELHQTPDPVIDPQPVPVTDDPQPEAPADPADVEPTAEDPVNEDPVTEAPVTETPQPIEQAIPITHTAEIELILPERITMIAGDSLALYVIDPDLNTDPHAVETTQALIFSYDYFESVITLTETGEDSDRFLAWIKPVFEPGEDPFEFRVCDYFTSPVVIDYYDPVNAEGVSNYYRSMSFDVQPY